MVRVEDGRTGKEVAAVWVRVDVAVPEHRKTKRLRSALQQRGATAIQLPATHTILLTGIVATLWIKTRLQAPDGFFSGYTREDMVNLLDLDQGGGQIVDALIEAGYLEQRTDGFAIPDWMEHNGQHLREARRVAASRSSKRGATAEPAPSSDSIVPSRPVPSCPVASTSADNPERSPNVRRTGQDEAAANRARARSLVEGVAGALTLPQAAPAPGSASKAERDEIAALAGSLGAKGVSGAIRLAQWLEKRGVAHGGLRIRFVRHFVAGYSRIANPFAYYNPGAAGFDAIRSQLASEMAQDEAAALKAAEATWLAGAAS